MHQGNIDRQNATLEHPWDLAQEHRHMVASGTVHRVPHVLRYEERIEKELKKARNAADKLIAEGKDEANKIIREGEEATSRKVEQMLADAHSKIEEDILNAQKKLESDIRILIADATEVILDEKIDHSKDISMIDKALAKVRSI